MYPKRHLSSFFTAGQFSVIFVLESSAIRASFSGPPEASFLFFSLPLSA